MTHILLLHPGAMGAAVGASLVGAGHDVCWNPPDRSAATAARAERAGLREWDAQRRPDLVVSICPPDAALTTAQTYAQLATTYIDANAVGPATAGDIAAVITRYGGEYIDGSIIGPPPGPDNPAATRLYLSGAQAGPTVLRLGATPGLDVKYLAGDPYAASALKMAYASWTKISAALLLSSRRLAAEYGVDAALLDEWAHSQPGLSARHDAAADQAAGKAWRWTGEMREIARTYAERGLPPGFGEAAAQVFEHLPLR